MTISNYDLIILAKKHNVRLSINDIVMSDELNLLRKRKHMNIIINSKPTGNSGRHWVCLLVRNDYAFYFDSFGTINDKNVFNFCKKHSLHLAQNTWIVQNINSTQCGRFCFALMKYEKDEKIPKDTPLEFPSELTLYEKCNNFINMFVSDTRKSDALLNKYLGSRQFS